MAVKLLFLGKLADLAGTDERDVGGPIDWAGLVAALEPELAEAVQAAKVRVAVNGALLTDKSALNVQDGDEIALLPPVSGG